MCIYPHWLSLTGDYSYRTSCSNAFFIILDDYEAKVAENETYITELLEKKTQAEEQKQIITG